MIWHYYYYNQWEWREGIEKNEREREKQMNGGDEWNENKQRNANESWFGMRREEACTPFYTQKLVWVINHVLSLIALDTIFLFSLQWCTFFKLFYTCISNADVDYFFDFSTTCLWWHMLNTKIYKIMSILLVEFCELRGPTLFKIVTN